MSTASVGAVVGSIGGVAAAAKNLSKSILGLTGGSDGSIGTSMRQASYAGLPCGVKEVTLSSGRKTAVHEYAFRDEVWIEDLGRRGRRFTLTAFLLEDDLIYKGGPVIAQRDAFLRVLEQKPNKSSVGYTLVHPTMGTINNVVCLNSEFLERDDTTRQIGFRLDLAVSGARIYPSQVVSTTQQTLSAAEALKKASLADFVNAVVNDLEKGAAVVEQAVNTVVQWYQVATGLIHDVKRVFSSISTLAGNFGNVFGGGNDGYANSNPKASASTTVASLLAADVVAVAAVKSAGARMVSAAAAVSDSAAFGASLVALSDSVGTTANDPADAIRLLSTLAGFVPSGVTTASPIGIAMGSMQTAVGALARRTAMASLGVMSSSYQPSSSDDAISVRNSIAGLIDAEALIAADSGDDASYSALVNLREAVIDDLSVRGAQLAAMRTFTFASPINALSLATRIYRDASRADQLVSLAQPIHPAFVSPTFTALES